MSPRTTTAATLSHESDPAWDEAFLRVESYLRALHVESRVLLNRLATEIVTEAKGVALADARHPVQVAMQVAQSRCDAWFARLANLTSGEKTNEKFRVKGRLALLMADRQGEWARYFLSGEEPPASLVAAMNSPGVQAGPEVRFSNMPPAPLEFDSEESRQQLQPAIRSVLIRAAGVWLSIIGLMGVAWATSH
jgi:hypothetical protein